LQRGYIRRLEACIIKCLMIALIDKPRTRYVTISNGTFFVTIADFALCLAALLPSKAARLSLVTTLSRSENGNISSNANLGGIEEG